MKELSIDEMKKIAYDVIDEERKKHNLNITVFPLTFIEYFDSYLRRKKYSLSRKIFMSLKPIVSGGFYDRNSSDVVVFLKSINVFQRVERKLFNLLRVCFHEVRHSEQMKFDSYSYDGFCRSIDDFMRFATLGVDYNLEHDNYFYEIDANLCSVRKAKDYLLKHYPDYYRENMEYINYLERRYEYDYLMYDLSYNIDRYLSFKKNVDSIKKSLNVEVVILGMNSISSVLEIFMNDDYSFKSVKDIINNNNFKLLDRKIVYSFFSSHSFLSSINFDDLSEEEKNVISEALNYTCNLYLEQKKYIDEAFNLNIIHNSQFVSNKREIIEKLKFITNYFNLQFKRIINPSRSDTDRIEHMKEVIDYLKIYDRPSRETEEFDEQNKEERLQVLVDKEEQARQEWNKSVSEESYYSYKDAIKDRLEYENEGRNVR